MDWTSIHFHLFFLLLSFLFTYVSVVHLCAWGYLFTIRQDHNYRWLEQVGPTWRRIFFLLPFGWSRWDKENTSSPGSLVFWLLLAWPIHLPVVTLASGFLPILLPSCPPSKHRLIHSFPLSLSSLSRIHSPLPNLATREVCGTEASIIDRASV